MKSKKKAENKSILLTNHDAIAEAEKRANPMLEVLNKKQDNFLKHSAIALSLLSIYSMALLCAYDRGFYSVYNIPFNYSNIDLRRMLPLLVIAVGGYSFITFYFGSLNYTQSHKGTSFVLHRILWGATFLVYAFSCLFQHLNRSWETIIISLAIPILIEIVVCIFKRIRIKREVLSSATYKKKIEVFESDNYLFWGFRKPVILIFIFLIIFAPFCGEYIARHKNVYCTLIIDEKNYVIVSTNGESAYIESYEEHDSYALIDTNHFMKISLNDYEIRNVEFAKVKFAKTK